MGIRFLLQWVPVALLNIRPDIYLSKYKQVILCSVNLFLLMCEIHLKMCEMWFMEYEMPGLICKQDLF